MPDARHAPKGGGGGTSAARRTRFGRISLVLVSGGVACAMAAGGHYVLAALSSESSRNFVPLSAFATVAAYRVFEAHDLPLPTFTSGVEAQGRPCFTADMPTPGLAGGFPCRLSVEIVAAPFPLPCSTWRREVCNVVALPAAMHRMAAFQSAFQSYITHPCRFVQDYRQLQDRVDAAAPSIASAAYYAQVIEADFRCRAPGDDQPGAHPASPVWRRLKPHLLLEGTSAQPGSLLEVRIKPPGR